MKKLANNTDLYNYLLSLGDRLAESGADTLAENARLAARQSAGLSTEFLGESRDALRHILDHAEGVLQLHELDELRGVIAQIDSALRR